MVWEWIIGSSATVVGLASYFAYRSSSRTADTLEEVPLYEPSARLPRKVERYPNQTIPFAAIRGEVRAVKEPLKCGNRDERQDCVIRRRTRNEVKSVFVSATKQWHSNTSTIYDVVQEVPLALHKSGSSRFDANGVQVKSPRDADGLPILHIRERFLPTANTGAMGVVTDFLAGEKLRGYEEIEKALPVGVVLTGIGELSLADGHVILRPPKGSLPYFLSPKSVEEIASSHRSQAKGLKIVLYICVIIGGSCLLFKLYRWWKVWWEDRRRRQQAAEFAVRQAELRREARQFGNGSAQTDQPRTCVVCWENTPDVVLLNCGHLCACSSCVTSLTHCPICRSGIERFVPVFPSSHD